MWDRLHTRISVTYITPRAPRRSSSWSAGHRRSSLFDEPKMTRVLPKGGNNAPSSSRPWTPSFRRPTGACVGRKLTTSAKSKSACDGSTCSSVPDNTYTPTPPMGRRRLTSLGSRRSGPTVSSRTTAEPSRSIVMASLSASLPIAACNHLLRWTCHERVRKPRAIFPIKSPRARSMPSHGY